MVHRAHQHRSERRFYRKVLQSQLWQITDLAHRCDGAFTVALIPHSLAETTLGERRPGDRVNLEADILLKQVAALLRASPPGSRETRLRGTGEGGARVPRR